MSLFLCMLFSLVYLSSASHKLLRFSINGSLNSSQLLHEIADKRSFDVWASNPSWLDLMIPETDLNEAAQLGVPFIVVMNNVESMIEEHLREVKVHWITLLT